MTCLSGFGASGISVDVWRTLCVFAVWLFQPLVAGERRQARKHSCANVLRELATTP